jgi:hypothetical protein
MTSVANRRCGSRLYRRAAGQGRGATLNQFINVAVAEKIAALRTADFFRERAGRANVEAALALLDRLGNDGPNPA